MMSNREVGETEKIKLGARKRENVRYERAKEKKDVKREFKKLGLRNAK